MGMVVVVVMGMEWDTLGEGERGSEPFHLHDQVRGAGGEGDLGNKGQN